MKKLIIISSIILLVLAGVFFYLGFHTYFIRTEVNEELPQAMRSVEPADSSPTAQPMEPDSQASVVATGEFGEIDFVHKGSGQAKLIELDGKTILRFENFNVTSGPDLYVYLSDSENPGHGDESLGNYVSLGLLKATSGNQNYDVPPEAAGYRTAVQAVWRSFFFCRDAVAINV